MSDIKGYLEKNIFPVKDTIFKLNDELITAKKQLHASPLYKKFHSLNARVRLLNYKLKKGYEGLEEFR